MTEGDGVDPGPGDGRIADLSDDLAVPRRNGELVFGAPREGRIFGLAVALSECKADAWDSFRERLLGQHGRPVHEGAHHVGIEQFRQVRGEHRISRGARYIGTDIVGHDRADRVLIHRPMCNGGAECLSVVDRPHPS